MLLVLRCAFALALLSPLWRVFLRLSGPEAIRQSFQHPCPDNLLEKQLPDSNELIKQTEYYGVCDSCYYQSVDILGLDRKEYSGLIPFPVL